MSWLSHPDVDEIIRVPGYLHINPTSKTTEAGWGTKIGYVEKGVIIRIDYKTLLLDEEDSGLDWKYKLFLGVNVKLIATLKNWNAGIISQLVPGMSSTTNMGMRNSYKTGNLQTTNYKVLYVPEDRTNNPCFYLRAGRPNIMGDITANRGKDMEFPLAWDGFNSSGDSLFYFGTWAGLTL